MIIYHPNWQRNRVDFIINQCIPSRDYPHSLSSLRDNDSFLIGREILELGSFNGNIGAQFYFMGANVTCVEGRKENVEVIKKCHPYLNVIHADLDTPEWDLGKYDIIINFGLFYHLEKFHKEHLTNCINNSDIMYFESVVYDSFKSELIFRDEQGSDQSLSNKGGTPTTSYIENIFKDNECKFIKYSSASLNSEQHHYNWMDSGNKSFDQYARRFWVVM